MRHAFLFFLFFALTIASPAEELVCEGVLGNSGVAGASLASGYRHGSVESMHRGIGMGVAVDATPTIWARTAPGVLARFAIDGRQLATFELPKAIGANDNLAMVDTTLLLLIDSSLYTLATTAEPGSSAQPLNMKAQRISAGSANGRVALLQDGANVVLLEPTTGQVTPFGNIGHNNPSTLEMDPEGAIYTLTGKRGTVQKFVNGEEVTDGWPRDTTGRRESPPSRLTYANNAWYGFGWYGTVKRYTAELEPAPGVAIGGSSGWFIGTVPGDSDLDSAGGIAHLRDNLYIVSGSTGVLQVLRWRPDEQRMTLERRIGPLQPTLGVSLDSQGRIFDGHGTWHWEDGPTDAYRDGFFARASGELTVLPSDAICGPGMRYSDRFVWIYGQPNPRPEHRQVQPGFGMDEKGLAATVATVNGKRVAIVLEPGGDGGEFQIGHDGRHHRLLNPLTLETAQPVSRWHSLTAHDDRLIAAGDGWVIHFERDGDAWRETERWQSWEGDRLGQRLSLAADAGRLWIVDSERHRLLCFHLATRRPLATFGETDMPGSAIGQLREPGAISVHGDRAVLVDAGNFRLLKLTLLQD